ncbi:MAG: cobalt ABC transporter [Brooklawnia sp.]|jgi:uridine kinase
MSRNITLPADWDLLVGAVLEAARHRRLVVLLDGGSGAGKTTLAQCLQARLAEALGPVQLVSLDDIYPGWGGLAAASAWVWQQVLHPVTPGHGKWSWEAGRMTGRVELDPRLPIIIEGCGALSRESAPLASSRLWFQMDAAARRARALGRDGQIFAPHWEQWAAQEAAHWHRNRPLQLADLVISA